MDSISCLSALGAMLYGYGLHVCGRPARQPLLESDIAEEDVHGITEHTCTCFWIDDQWSVHDVLP